MGSFSNMKLRPFLLPKIAVSFKPWVLLFHSEVSPYKTISSPNRGVMYVVIIIVSFGTLHGAYNINICSVTSPSSGFVFMISCISKCFCVKEFS